MKEKLYRIGDWFILKASYCDSCTDDEPCKECLELCNRFVISGEHKTTSGYDWFFGGDYCAKPGSCRLTEARCSVLTTDKEKAKQFGVHHVSETIPIKP